MSRLGFILFCFLTTEAQAGYNIGSSSGPFGVFIDWLQTLLDALDGPIGIAVVVISLIAGILLWINQPRSGALAWVIRAIVGGLAVFNVAIIVNSLQ
jgi:type IV secretory pathway VirB2 component (pilin)